MAAHFEDDDDDLWQMAESHVDLFPPRHRVNWLTDLDEVKLHARLRNSSVLYQWQ